MLQVDRIRMFVKMYYIEPARRNRQSTITIRAGDVAKKMRLFRRDPNINNALRGRKLQEMCNIRFIERNGPYESTTTTYTYEILY